MTGLITKCPMAALVATTLALLGCMRAPAVDPAAESRAVTISNQQRFQAPRAWTWGRMVNADGAQLRFGWTDFAIPIRGVIVLAPSFQAPLEHYFETARDLAQKGYAIWIMDRRGQGGSDRWPDAGQRAYLEGGWREVRDLRQFTLLARTRYPGAPAYLIGESFGGLVGLRLLHDSPELFAAAAFSSPGIDFQTNGVPRGILRGVTSLSCWLGRCKQYAPTQHDWVFNADAGGPTDPYKDDPERALAEQGLFSTHPELREGDATNGFVVTLFEEARTEEAPGWPEAIRIPILFGYTPKDRVSRTDVMQSECHRMPRCKLARFMSTGHGLFNDADDTRNEWMRQLDSFLKESSQGG